MQNFLIKLTEQVKVLVLFINKSIFLIKVGLYLMLCKFIFIIPI